jgi:hypothetical protein
VLDRALPRPELGPVVLRELARPTSVGVLVW